VPDAAFPVAPSRHRLQRWLPICGWLRRYTREDFQGDLLAGFVTAILLVPQGMAFALLAGLPAQIGLYVSILPPIAYALLGTSRALAVGPVSVASIMVAQALRDLPAGTDPVNAAIVLALLSGAMLLAMGLARFGVIASFLSHPVLSGFTTAAALLIIANQLPSLAGLRLPQHASWQALPARLSEALASVHGATATVGLGAIALLLLAGTPLIALLTRAGMPQRRALIVSRAAPLAAVVAGTVAVGAWDAARGSVAIVGTIPEGLPDLRLALPEPGLVWRLLPAGFLIALVGYVESISIAKFLAGRHRQPIDANQELIALGAANLAAGVSGGMPVAGGFSRTMVNYTAGARTQLAAIVTALLVALVAVFFTAALADVPKAALAAIIIVAVAQLVDLKGALAVWKYDRVDGAVLALTAAGVLVLGIEPGLAVGIMASLASFALRAARPHVAVLGRIRGSEHFRNVRRHPVETWPHLLFLRVDENLTFANAAFLESVVMNELATHPQVRHIVLVMSSVNAIDGTALATLERLAENAHEARVTLHLSDVKGPVMDRLRPTALLELLEPGKVFLSAHEAAEALADPPPEPRRAWRTEGEERRAPTGISAPRWGSSAPPCAPDRSRRRCRPLRPRRRRA
jgi:SulP family sulfate permease